METSLSFLGRKGLPQGRALPLITSPCMAQLQAPGPPPAGSEEENTGAQGGRSRVSAPQSHSPTPLKAHASSSSWARLQERSDASYTLGSASILQMEEWEPRAGTGTRRQSWGERTPGPQLTSSLFLLSWQP